MGDCDKRVILRETDRERHVEQEVYEEEGRSRRRDTFIASVALAVTPSWAPFKL